MPQLHHRDPAIIGLLGAGGLYSTCEVGEVPSSNSLSVSLSSSPAPLGVTKSPVGPNSLERKIPAPIPTSATPLPAAESAVDGGNSTPQYKMRSAGTGVAEALDDLLTPPQTPVLPPQKCPRSTKDKSGVKMDPEFQREGMPSVAHGDTYARPYYGLIVDGIHSHPNSVRVSLVMVFEYVSETLTISIHS